MITSDSSARSTISSIGRWHITRRKPDTSTTFSTTAPTSTATRHTPRPTIYSSEPTASRPTTSLSRAVATWTVSSVATGGGQSLTAYVTGLYTWFWVKW